MRTGYKILLVGAGIGVSYFVYRKFFSRMISDKGLTFLTVLEGKKNKAYKDVKGLWTTGVGHLIDLAKEAHLVSKTLTDTEVKAILDKDLDRFEKVVNDTIKVPLTPAKKDALYSIAFNIGETAFKNSSLAKVVNGNGTPEDIIKAFSMWKKPKQLEARRAKEARLFLTGNYSTLLSPTDFQKYFKA